MPIVEWLYDHHEFFCDLGSHLLDVVRERAVADLDDLVVKSRRPVRTVLLMLDELVRRGVVTIGPDGIVATGVDGSRGPSPGMLVGRSRWDAGVLLGDRATTYRELAACRELPVLLWSQRRLVPESALERAAYILSWMDRVRGTVLFLGDDDLVSPLVAAADSRWNVHVVDIDATVLECASRTAARLGASVKTHHMDISKAVPLYKGQCDLVVSDPFPSGDGSFEALFWQSSVELLRPHGLSISTIGASHKPVGFEARALRKQEELGLDLVDLVADFGRYETFDFEFTPFERAILGRHGLASSISQTKSIMAARRRASVPKEVSQVVAFDFTRWSAAIAEHYLTVQAGVEEQRRIATRRGADVTVAARPESARRGLRVELVLPADVRSHLSAAAGHAKPSAPEWARILEPLGVGASREEIDELVRLQETADIRADGPLAELGLAIRAMESWERWRFDDD